jgi:hypothetical protein
MSKITSEHLARAAYIYMYVSRRLTKWSTILRVSAASMAWWSAPGRSGGGTARPGFEKTTGRDLRRQGWRSGIAGSLAPCAERA